MGGEPSARASEEHKKRARRLRELANVAPSRSEQARLNSRAEMFDALARMWSSRLSRTRGGCRSSGNEARTWAMSATLLLRDMHGRSGTIELFTVRNHFALQLRLSGDGLVGIE